MSDTPNPIQIQKFLGGVDYPAGRDALVAEAEGEGADDADDAVLEALRNLPDREFDGPTGVSEEVATWTTLFRPRPIRA